MSRWRPPPPRSTAIITRAGFEKLKAELDHLWHTLRPEVVRALAAAAAEGDRSENAECTPADAQAIFFGATCEIEDVRSGETKRYRIVGPDETDAMLGLMSIEPP